MDRVVFVGNEPADFTEFMGWLDQPSRPVPRVALAFNQYSAQQLQSSVPWVVAQGQKFMELGAAIDWSVPAPGPRQLENVNGGIHDDLYIYIAQLIAKAVPTAARIPLRIMWEFDLAHQENAARDKNGNWDAKLYTRAFRRISAIFKAVSPRFWIVWCPGVAAETLDITGQCWPGVNFVDEVAVDFYMQKQYAKPGDIGWFLDHKFGLKAMKAWAVHKGKAFGVTEYGFDDDMFRGDAEVFYTWAKLNCDNIGLWERPEVIDCMLRKGRLPRLGSLYKSMT